MLRRLPASTVLEPAVPVPDSLYLAFLDEVEAEGPVAAGPARRRVVARRRRFRWCIRIPRAGGANLNEDSVVLLVEYPGRFGSCSPAMPGFGRGPARGRLGRVQFCRPVTTATATGDRWLAELKR
jgi:hypothetical protein